ncbi:hypothetical protein Z043_125919, partial [Scleropages formosus]
MSEPRYRDWILETIDSLRSRKARPDLERICRMVRRRYGWDADRTCAELEKLIQEQTVLRERLAQEKLTRSRVKVVLEREVARGRLRRTRFGNITLPVSARPRPIAPGAPKSSARALKSAPRERPATEKVRKTSMSDTSCIPRTAAAVGAAWVGGGGAEGGLPLRAVCPSTGGTELGVEENAVTPDQLASNAQDQVMAEPEEELQTSCVPANGCSDFKVEGGVASCLLTPTSSPQDLGAATKEQRLNGEVMVKMEKSAQNPVEWTVSDV